MRQILLFALLAFACSSGSDAGSATGTCPNLSGTWHITQHCDASLVGMDVEVSQSACSLSFGAPFDRFSATVDGDAKVTVSGVQSCTGSATASLLSLNCSPGTCVVALSR